MASHTPEGMDHSSPAGFAVSLSGDDDATFRGFWKALSGSGSVTMPLEQAPWGDSFGMCVDRFGISWMVNISGEAF